jgi:hypothetical protein
MVGGANRLLAWSPLADGGLVAPPIGCRLLFCDNQFEKIRRLYRAAGVAAGSKWTG